MFLAPDAPVTSQTMQLAGGRAGVMQTLALMRQLIDHYKKDPHIRAVANSVVFLQPEKSALHELKALHEYVQSHIRYVRDVAGVETVQTPDRTIALRYGDCDDQTTLFCALAESVGYPTRLVCAGYEMPGVFEHVYAQAFAAGQWWGADCTEDEPLGWEPPAPVSLWIESR